MKAMEWVNQQKERKLRIDPNAQGFIIPRARMADGFEISIQASKYHYCLPRKDLADSYSSFELGYASEFEPLLEAYREGDIFPWVPAEIVDLLVEKHGGIAGPA